jgi:type IV secretion system protein VirD4
MCYNPFAYIKKETDIQKLVTTLMENTKEPDEKGQDPFWPKSEKLLYNAIIALIMEKEVKEKRNMITMIEKIDDIKVAATEDDQPSKIEIEFEDWEKSNGETYAVRQWHKFCKAAGKTKASILASVGGRMSPFDIDTLREKMEFDELALDTIGDEKTVMFFIIDDSDTTFNFLVSMALSQMFNCLKAKADRQGGHLRHHVRVLWDETYNTGQVPRLEHLISQLRSRGISLWMFFQAKNQLVDLYGDKKAENIEANCDVKGFLGGNETTSWKDWSELLGSETIDVLDQADTYGATRSTGNNYKKIGKKLMPVEDIANMAGNKCLIKLRGVPPFFSDKYNCMEHPYFKYTADADKRYRFNLRKYLNEFRNEFLIEDDQYDLVEIDLTQAG